MTKETNCVTPYQSIKYIRFNNSILLTKVEVNVIMVNCIDVSKET